MVWRICESEFIPVYLVRLCRRFLSVTRSCSPSRTPFGETNTLWACGYCVLLIQLYKFTLFYLEKKERAVQGAIRPE